MSRFTNHVQTATRINPPSARWLLRVSASRLRNAGALSLAASLALLSFGVSQALAQNREKVIHIFKGAPNEAGIPESGVVADKAGNLYGTALRGCTANQGLVYRIAPDGTETILHCFTGDDGGGPYATVELDSSGNIYGTTYGGGVNNVGAVFKLAPDGTETVLHSFATGGADGYLPISSVVEYKGSLYGTTSEGSSTNGGIFYKISQSGVETILHTFAPNGNGKDGSSPWGTPIVDNDGNFYGTTVMGGTTDTGTVYKIDAKGKETVLYSFKGGTDGGYPNAAVIRDASGNFYGTTQGGGANQSGAIFKLAVDGTETVLYSFLGTTDGLYPSGALLSDRAGDLYGTAAEGGTANYGTVFELSALGKFTVLHSFAGGKDGEYPQFVTLIKDDAFATGYLFGTTAAGSKNGNGTVFKVKIQAPK